MGSGEGAGLGAIFFDVRTFVGSFIVVAWRGVWGVSNVVVGGVLAVS